MPAVRDAQREQTGRKKTSKEKPERVTGMKESAVFCRQAAGIITEITDLKFCFLENEDTLESFREDYCFFSGQSEFAASYPEEMKKKLSDGRIVHVRDELGVNFAYFMAGGCLVAAGPFLTETLSRREMRSLLERNRMKETDSLALEVYLSPFPVMDQAEAVGIVRALLHGADPGAGDGRLTEEVHEPRNDLTAASGPDIEQRINYTLLLEKRYGYERAFRRNVMEGDERAAIMNLRNMYADTAYLSKSGNSLENVQAGAAIIRTMTRLAALDGGLSDIIADRISSRNAQETRRIQSAEESMKHSEAMVRTYCKVIQAIRRDRYSALVQSVIYQIEHHYQDDISLSDLAEELAVSKNYLIQRFKAETGQTPVRYLTDIRMKRAAQLLSEQVLSIQEIASIVGVPDSNYFTKLFKKTYGVTPKQYRKERIV